MKNIHELFPVNAVPSDGVEYQEAVLGRQWGVKNDVGQIREVLMKRPGVEISDMINEKTCDYNELYGAWVHKEKKGYWISPDGSLPDLEKMQAQHDQLSQILQAEGSTVVYMDEDLKKTDEFRSITNVRDVIFSIPGGAVISRMGPAMRHGEEQVAQRTLARLNVPINGRIVGKGVFEGGSFGFLTPKLAYAGHSKRGNWEAIRQLTSILQAFDIELLTIPLVGHSLHTDSAFTMVDHQKALYIPGRLPYWFLEKMEELEIEGIEVEQSERWAVNSLTVRPGKVIAAKEAERSIERMTKAGLEVIPLDYQEVQKNGGGIHCTTNPLFREGL